MLSICIFASLKSPRLKASRAVCNFSPAFSPHSRKEERATEARKKYHCLHNCCSSVSEDKIINNIRIFAASNIDKWYFSFLKISDVWNNYLSSPYPVRIKAVLVRTKSKRIGTEQIRG